MIIIVEPGCAGARWDDDDDDDDLFDEQAGEDWQRKRVRFTEKIKTGV